MATISAATQAAIQQAVDSQATAQASDADAAVKDAAATAADGKNIADHKTALADATACILALTSDPAIAPTIPPPAPATK